MCESNFKTISKINAIHVGLPKCASNLLQRDILMNHNGLECVTPKFTEVLKPYVNNFLAFGSDWKGKEFAEMCNKQFVNSNSIKILSQEGFAGDMITGQNSYIIPKILYELFGKVKIIIVLREQRDYLFSVYRHLVKRGETFSYKRFLKRYGEEKSQNLTDMPGANLLVRLKYSELIDLYFDLFGKDNVLVLLYEDLKKDIQHFADQIYDFFDVPKVTAESKVFNKGLSNPSLQTWANFITATPYNNGKIRFMPKRFSQGMIKLQRVLNNKASISAYNCFKFLPNRYIHAIKESNQELAKLLGRDLEKYGYIV